MSKPLKVPKPYIPVTPYCLADTWTSTLSPEQLRDLYLFEQINAGFHPGDRVRVYRSFVGTFKRGWSNSWTDAMNETLNETYNVTGIYGESGITLSGIALSYPWYVLEKVKEEDVLDEVATAEEQTLEVLLAGEPDDD